MSRRKIGIYPGTFDPVHEGHIAFCLAALQACDLDEVVILPEQKPRGKQNVTAVSRRTQQLKKATGELSNLRVIELSSRQFTVRQTLPELQQLFTDAELTLLVGSDVVRTFLYRWEGVGTLLKNMNVAIGLRGTDTAQDMHDIIQQIEQEHGLTASYIIVETPHTHLSSSKLRTAKT